MSPFEYILFFDVCSSGMDNKERINMESLLTTTPRQIRKRVNSFIDRDDSKSLDLMLQALDGDVFKDLKWPLSQQYIEKSSVQCLSRLIQLGCDINFGAERERKKYRTAPSGSEKRQEFGKMSFGQWSIFVHAQQSK
jgi:hypothetical protein